MYVCFGENEARGYDYGTGNTVEEAIFSWAHSSEPQDVMREFDTYNPEIVKGEKLKVTMQVETVITFTETHSF